jgi:hypothetical protein
MYDAGEDAGAAFCRGARVPNQKNITWQTLANHLLPMTKASTAHCRCVKVGVVVPTAPSHVPSVDVAAVPVHVHSVTGTV